MLPYMAYMDPMGMLVLKLSMSIPMSIPIFFSPPRGVAIHPLPRDGGRSGERQPRAAAAAGAHAAGRGARGLQAKEEEPRLRTEEFRGFLLMIFGGTFLGCWFDPLYHE